jgi:hypothetical protein
MKTLKIGAVALVAVLSLAGCNGSRLTRNPGEPCSTSQRGTVAYARTDGHRLTCAATNADRVLRWR